VLMGAMLLITVMAAPQGFVLGIGGLLGRLGRRKPVLQEAEA